MKPDILLAGAALILISASHFAHAQQQVFVPRLFDVAGVAADDTLNIRASGAASAAIVGELAPNATGIEVTALNAAETWGRITAGEIDGWVSMTYLDAVAFPPGDIPDGMRCIGNEPFWSLGFEDGTMHYSTPERDWPDLPLVAAPTRIPPGNQIYGFDAPISGGSLSGVIEAGWCSDGMSDRTYGWSVVLLRQETREMILETGCCTLDQR